MHERDHQHTHVQRKATAQDDDVAPGRGSRSAALTAPTQPVASGVIQPKADEHGTSAGSDHVNADALERADSSASRGLPGELRDRLEGTLRVDLSSVRVHTGDESAHLARRLDAHAFAYGQDIHFGAGTYQPDTREGQALIAHEVAHTVQQRGATKQTQTKLEVSAPSDSHEIEAEQFAQGFVSGDGSQASPTSVGISVSRAAIARSGPISLAPAGAAPSAKPIGAAAAAARVRGLTQLFHDRMREANAIFADTRFHYDYVNGIYRENFKIYQVVLGQANGQWETNEKIRGFLIDQALTLVGLGLEAKAAAAAAKVGERCLTAVLRAEVTAREMKQYSEIMGAVGKLKSAGSMLMMFMPKPAEAEGGSGPTDPSALELVGQKNLVSALSHVNGFRDAGDMVLDSATDLTIGLAASGESGESSKSGPAAINEVMLVCEALLQETERLLAEVRVLQKRRGVPVPSWHECEQDIWLAYFASKGGDYPGGSNLLDKHMVDIGMWGPDGTAGGRLQIDAGIDGFTRAPTVDLPGKEDEKKQQSTQHFHVTRTDLINRAAAELPAKWARIMLLRD